MKQAARIVFLACLAAGLAASPAVGASRGLQAAFLGFAAAAALLGAAGGTGPPRVRVAALALAGLGLGLAAGSARIAAIDAGALRGEPGAELSVSGVLATAPRRDARGVSAELETAQGRVLVSSFDLGGSRAGERIAAAGRQEEPDPWRAAMLRRHGISLVLEAESVAGAGPPRGGLAGRIDLVRNRAEDALGRGMPDPEAALARGFVLGQDDAIDPRTREDFRRSGLAHLLAVSGQNVVLLCLLAWPLLALAGIPLRHRLLVLIAIVAVYVPVTGAGASIQRAGIMGAAGLVAALAGRPTSRWYALGLAAVVTLAVNPRASGDVGWQLSFAAVAGIFLWTSRLAALLDGGSAPGSPRRSLAEGAAMTIAATIATAPLMAHHFESLSPAALPANLLALPAVAPAMWLGMLAGMAGQVPGAPVEPLNFLGSLCIAYIAQVARWFGSPRWASLEVQLADPAAVALAFAVLAGAVELGLRAASRAGTRTLSLPRRAPKLLAAAAAAGAIAVLAAAGVASGPDRPPAGSLRVTVLDVGQGDSILLEPPGADPLLVDAGPPGSDVAGDLRARGIDRLAALVVTHDESDHSGGVEGVLAAVPAHRLAAARVSRHLASAAGAAGTATLSLAEGGELRSGELRLEVLWPPRALLSHPVDDPNTQSLVLLAEWRHFSMLLTGDAEAEAVPIEPGPVDVLKVAHHGSADAGLESMLRLTVPDLAVISAGRGNPFGHPSPDALAALGEAGVPVARTDAEGDVAIEADAAGWRVAP